MIVFFFSLYEILVYSHAYEDFNMHAMEASMHVEEGRNHGYRRDSHFQRHVSAISTSEEVKKKNNHFFENQLVLLMKMTNYYSHKHIRFCKSLSPVRTALLIVGCFVNDIQGLHILII